MIDRAYTSILNFISGLTLDVTAIFSIALILIGVYKLLHMIVEWSTIRKVTAIVEHKERVLYSRTGRSMYLIYTSEGVLKNTDSIAWMKFNSSDIYSSLKVGETYEFTICDLRIRIYSTYANIIKARKLDMDIEYEKGILNII